jgi:hypothetical protein
VLGSSTVITSLPHAVNSCRWAASNMILKVGLTSSRRPSFVSNTRKYLPERGRWGCDVTVLKDQRSIIHKGPSSRVSCSVDHHYPCTWCCTQEPPNHSGIVWDSNSLGTRPIAVQHVQTGARLRIPHPAKHIPHPHTPQLPIALPWSRTPVWIMTGRMLVLHTGAVHTRAAADRRTLIT